jgi:hypothetical protein
MSLWATPRLSRIRLRGDTASVGIRDRASSARAMTVGMSWRYAAIMTRMANTSPR